MALGDVLLKIQKAIAKVEKDGTNPHTKSGYPTLEAVLDVINPQLDEHGVGLRQFPVFANQWCLRTKVSHGTDSDEFDVPLLGVEGAKNQMQALGSAITYARRYGLLGYFKLAPTDDDGNSSAGLTVISEKKAEPAKKAPPKNSAPQQSKDMKIPDGRFKGKMLSTVPREDLQAYIEEVLQIMETSGRKPPKWFEDLRKVSGL